MSITGQVRRRTLRFGVRLRSAQARVECCVEVMWAAVRHARSTKLVDVRIERAERIEVDAIGEHGAVAGSDGDLDAGRACIEQDVAIARSQGPERTARVGRGGRLGRCRRRGYGAAAAKAEEHESESGGRFHDPIIAPLGAGLHATQSVILLP